MEKKTVNDKYINPNGSETKYQVDTYKNENQNPIIVVRNAPDNQGQKFGETWQKRDQVTDNLAKDAYEKFQIAHPEKIQMYQERLDGKFDKVEFNYSSNKQGELAWGERGRVTYTKEQFDQTLKEYEKGQHQEQEKMKLPSDDRSKLLENREEIKNYQKQVNEQEITR